MSPRNPATKTVPPGVDRPLPEVPSAPPIDDPAAVAVAERPKPPNKKAAPPEPSDLIGEEIAREKRLALAREQLSFRRFHLLKAGSDLSSPEMSLLKTAVPRRPEIDRAAWNLNWDRFLRQENVRAGRVIHLQSAAGTPDDRAASDAAAVDTAAALAAEAPAIEEQIIELKNQLAGMHQAAGNAQAAADARRQAVANLKDTKLLPQFVRDELDSLTREHGRSFRYELQRLESRQNALTGLIALDPDESPEVIKSHIGNDARFGADEIERLKHGFRFTAEQRPGGVAHRFGELRPGVWESCVEELRTELVDVESRIEEIADGQQREADAEIERLRSHYVPT